MELIQARLKQAKELANEKKNQERKNDYTVSTGNIFADLELPNPEERQLKARLASLIYDVLGERKWTQKQSAEVLGISQPDVSKLTRGILKDFSVERLFSFLAKLEYRVTITAQEDKRPAKSKKIIVLPSQKSGVARV